MKKQPEFTVALSALFLFFIQSAFSQRKVDFSKKGEVHQQVIEAWNAHYREYFTSELKKRLFEDRDVYVLYDIQIRGLQSFVEMTRRCKDTRQMAELVELLSPVFSQLKSVSETDSSTGWVCSGGSICTAYGLLEKEVPLCSAQFLGLLGALATSISENIPPHKRTIAEKKFLSNAFNAMAVQVNRWFTSAYFASVERRHHITPADFKNGRAGFYFSDKDLWCLAILSDLSALHQLGIKPAGKDGKIAFESLLSKKAGIQKTFELFVIRTFLTPFSKGVTASLDQGFMKHHFDHRYANYTGETIPVSWKEGSDGKWEMKTHVEWDSSYLVNDVSWDISHARRLVPALETFARNRENIKVVWGYADPSFDPKAFRLAFANQIVEKIWNGDTKYPLFTNFWSGANGWYRVAYANQSGRRFSGYPPFGLTSSVPEGGYPVWGAFHPTLNTLFRSFYDMGKSGDAATKSFVSQYYPQLFDKITDKTSTKQVISLSFLADLVELNNTSRGGSAN